MYRTVKDRKLNSKLDWLVRTSFGRRVSPRGAGGEGTNGTGDAGGLLINRRMEKAVWKRARRYRLLYVFLSVPLLLFVVFNYVPMFGLMIAFKDYEIYKGFLASPWNNFRHFRVFVSGLYFSRVMGNTVIISLLKIIFGFPAPIALALLINEIGNQHYKRTVQTISYLPHFISWVVLSGMLFEILSPQRGLLGYAYSLFGQVAPSILTEKALFRPVLVVTHVWKTMGYGTVVYLAAISSIDPGLYEAAHIDGASRLQQAVHVTLPSIVSVITILFILQLGSILNAGFDQVFNLYNPLVYEVGDIIDTYVYRVGLIERRYDFSTAVGLFKNVVGVALIVGANAVIRRFSEHGIW